MSAPVTADGETGREPDRRAPGAQEAVAQEAVAREAVARSFFAQLRWQGPTPELSMSARALFGSPRSSVTPAYGVARSSASQR